MVEKPAPQVFVLRLGSAALRSDESRVRWVYAIQCADEEALRRQFAQLGGEALGPHEIQDILAALPSYTVLAGAGEIQAAARRDPGLRRALRAARESLRSQDTELSPTKRAPDRDKGAV